MAAAEHEPRAFPKARLVVAGVLFVAWLGYLSYLAWCSQDLVVVSRPQALVTDLAIIATVPDDGGEPGRLVSVTDVLWARPPGDRQLTGQEIVVDDLPAVTRGYDGPGPYLLLLSRTASGKTVHLTPLPAMPGFGGEGETRIYRATADVLAQVRQLLQE